MKTANVTRLLVGKLRGEHHPDQQLARRQITGRKKPTPKAQHAVELAALKANIAKLSTRQLQGLHARLKARLGKVALAKLMREARAK